MKEQMASNLAVTAAQWDQEVLNSSVPVLVDFWATWCGPCRMIAPYVEQLAEEYAGKAKVMKLDVDSEGSIAEKYGVMSIPTLFVFKDGKVVEQMVGAGRKQDIQSLLDRALAK